MIDNPKPLRVISLWQPWASLIMLGIKEYETRGWKVGFTGELVIHAAKKIIMPEEFNQDHLLIGKDITDTLNEIYGDFKNLPAGAILGTVKLGSIYPTEMIRDRLSKTERFCGDYRDNRYAWRLHDPIQLKEPIPFRGQQGLFYINPNDLHR